MRVFTQNIDSLESAAGLPKDMAHLHYLGPYIGHRRRHVYRAGIGVPVLKIDRLGESFPTVRGKCLYSHGL